MLVEVKEMEVEEGKAVKDAVRTGVGILGEGVTLSRIETITESAIIVWAASVSGCPRTVALTGGT